MSQEQEVKQKVYCNNCEFSDNRSWRKKYCNSFDAKRDEIKKLKEEFPDSIVEYKKALETMKYTGEDSEDIASSFDWLVNPSIKKREINPIGECKYYKSKPKWPKPERVSWWRKLLNLFNG